ncbi:TAT-variant-translocated molybdopterin oxidoreductase [Segetibacter sp.]|jgi:MoCo/4Fe-4S cofactor protein with predicted Tat translocation signal|uniref:TAT-variant-translocated molybdopterin oxidoreductase n=1 Tax=Segetibacter sp. TaxID=2231182 RepID=UPI002638892E|nr:TAT-variant-translocated molybdopterin oxidoreductase [Segetibacter sp.]MCW3080702.1 4Fe-4S dicluster protein [Segetibacter sp.]
MEQKRYWQSFGELNKSNAYQSTANDEFQEDLPLVEEDKGVLDARTPRRDFLKFLGFSTAAAAVAASCEMPVKKAIPFVNKPEDVIPGVANFYATTFVQDGEVIPAIAKVRDGRPIKIEGNDLSPVTLGGTSPRMQASVLDLYDTSRLRVPFANGKEVSTFDAFDKMVAADIAGLGGRPLVLLTSSITSPTTRLVISQFLAKFPGSRHVMYDAVSYSGMLLANEATYGRRAIPSYNLAAAKVIVGINADFLSSWVSPVEFNKQYSLGRKLNKKKPEMSRHIQFESLMSMTGANADERYHHKPSDSGAIATALYVALGGAATAPSLDPKLQQAIQKTASALAKSRGAAVVLAGSNDPSVQIVVNGINELIGANGTTINWSSTYNTHQAVDADINTLVNDMNAGAIGGLIIYEANPVYNYFNSDRFAQGLKKVKFSVSFNSKLDETSQLCKYVIPDHHYLESWGDAELRTGNISLIQPTINPLFKTRQWQDSLLKWSGAPTDYLGFYRQYWIARLGSEANWDKALQEGVINAGTSINTVLTNITSNSPDTARNVGVPGLETIAANRGGAAAFNGGAVGGAINAIGSAKKGGNTELVLYQKVTLGTGQQGNNPWLHEAPDPITKATWDNYAVISPAMAKSLFKIDLEDNGQTDDYEVHPEKEVMRVSVNGKTLELPIIIVPGTNPNTVGIALGYGRGTDAATTDDDADKRKALIESAYTNIGKAGGAVGKNAFPFVTFNGVTRDYFIPAVEVSNAGYQYKVAQSQTHQSYEGRTEVILETTLATLRKEPEMFSERREELHKDYAPKEGQNFERDATLYPLFPKPGIKWGMSIDLNSCTGCQACVVACMAENNVAVVGKEEVARYHDMAWLRIDRYFSGSLDNPSVVFQPMLCQHCDNAPCENVCPVAATMHSSEGINMMAYNRCIGTRYCANNCPYKVRRFNWSDYMGADSFPDNQKGIITEASAMMNDDLTRMVLNPDVTVRSRGVMEKCSFCVQRCQDGKLKAKKESRPLKSGENGEFDVKSACQQACPTDAIVFGNVNDKKSAVYQHRADNHDRLFYSLEMIHTLPNVSYLAKVRNSDAIVHLGEEEAQETIGGQEGKKEEKMEGVH